MKRLKPVRASKPWEETTTSKSLILLAESKGFVLLSTVSPSEWIWTGERFERLPEVLGVHGKHEARGVIFSAYWTDGLTPTATLRLRTPSWSVEPETRPRTRTPNRISPVPLTGYGHDRLVFRGGPDVPIRLSLTELRARIVADSDSDREGP